MSNNGGCGASQGNSQGEMSLRQWIGRPGRVVDRMESLHIFRQILDFVDVAHEHGVVLGNVRPSCFILSPCNRVAFIDSASTRSSSDRSPERSTGRASVPETQDDDGPFQSTSQFQGQGSSLDDGRVRATPSSAQDRREDGVGVDQSAVAAALQSWVESNNSRRGQDWRGNSGSVDTRVADGAMSTQTTEFNGRLEALEERGRSQESLGRMKSLEGRHRSQESPGRLQALEESGRSQESPRRLEALEESGRSQESSGPFEAFEESGGSEESPSRDSPVRKERFPLKQVLLREQTWYSSPEEHGGGTASFAADVYCLGVLFFELVCTCGSEAERVRVMSDLRHRILPPRLLAECPKEGAVCVRLLHPDPKLRPTARGVLECDLLSDAGEALAERQAAVGVEERAAESGLLLDFLLRMQHEKQDAVLKLSQDVARLTFDVEEVERRRYALMQRGRPLRRPESRDDFSRLPTAPLGHRMIGADAEEDRNSSVLGKRAREEGEGGRFSDVPGKKNADLSSKSARLMNNFTALEKVYFSMRWKVGAPSVEPTRVSPSNVGASSRVGGAGSNLMANGKRGRRDSDDWLGCFFDSLCKYARYSRFEVKATLRHGDLLNTANMVCSLSFDRDEEYFATAGVCKRIKIFECDALLNEHVDIHYPVAEMTSRSKLSCVCWNSYIKSHIASSDYDGVVQLWDATTRKPVMEYAEHERRAWSVDFSRADPTKLASGSDDGYVKLWSMNQDTSINTIKTRANVCCVQFPPDSSHLLVFGSADYKIYCYDLRTTKMPLCALESHTKAVSYLKFVDPVTLVSASTDNTLQLWDLTQASSNHGAKNARSLIYRGHLNEKLADAFLDEKAVSYCLNFVGLSVSDGYIACGSEGNSVFAYHKSLPMPLASHKFGSTDPITGQETEDDGGQFVSSVCWRAKSQTLVAANSMGNIKVLEMV